MATNYRFNKYVSLYDPDLILYALDKDPVKKEIDGVMFIEATTNFENVQMVRLDSLKPVGYVFRKY